MSAITGINFVKAALKIWCVSQVWLAVPRQAILIDREGMDIQYVILGSSVEMIYGVVWGKLCWTECKWFCNTVPVCLFSLTQLHQWCRGLETKSYQCHTRSARQVYPWYSVSPVERFTLGLETGSSPHTGCNCKTVFGVGERARQVHSGQRGRGSLMKPCSKVIWMKSSPCGEMWTFKMSRTVDTRISSFTFYVRDKKQFLNSFNSNWNTYKAYIFQQETKWYPAAVMHVKSVILYYALIDPSHWLTIVGTQF